ncbi:MAG: pitrilysin family protein [Bacteroidia bacterium]
MSTSSPTPHIDRTAAPAAGPLHIVPLPAYAQHHLSNGIPVYLLPFGQVDVLEVQAIFRAGRLYQPQTGVAHFTARNMTEGTASHSSLSLAQLLDGYGAWLSSDTDEESLCLKLATLTRHLPATLPLLREVIAEPTFPEEEFGKMMTRTLQKIEVDEEKTATLARKHFGQLMYGPDHFYGSYLGQPEVQALRRDMLVDYHQQLLHADNLILTVVGVFEAPTVLDLLEGTFGNLPRRADARIQPRAQMPDQAAAQGRHFFERKGMQSTIRLGQRAFARNHPDYYPMVVVNTILGGYFGSRLMKNIREEKGYTYGIYSVWNAMRHGGFLAIQSDIGNAYVEDAIAEVKREMRRLIDEGVSDAELDLVKNYLVGRSISRRETPFQISDLLRFSLTSDISFDELDRQYLVIRDIGREDIPAMAGRYFRPDELLEVVVGGK